MAGPPRPECWIRRRCRGGRILLATATTLGRSALVKVIRKGLLQLRIANLTKAGPRQRRAEGGVPSLLRPWVPIMSSVPSDLEFTSHPAGRLTICNFELQLLRGVAPAHRSSECNSKSQRL